jgi:hypothetical protein
MWVFLFCWEMTALHKVPNLGHLTADIEKPEIGLLVIRHANPYWYTDAGFSFFSWEMTALHKVPNLGHLTADIENYGIGRLVIRHANPYWYADVGFSFLVGR